MGQGESAMIFDVKRFAVHDGPGIRTALLLKGCPLRCRWCHNPEGLAAVPELAWYAHRCIGCGACAAVCRHGVHRQTASGAGPDRRRCAGCGECAAACPTGALRWFGRRVSVAEARELVLADREFYGTAGGVTLSGGEPALQPAFCAALFARLRRDDIHTALDSCGIVPWENFRMLLAETDLFLLDFKHADPRRHRELTGRSNRLLLANLKRLASLGKAVEIRIPLIPGANDDPENLRATAEFLRPLRPVRVRLLPYHPYAHTKYRALGKNDPLPAVAPPSAAAVSAAAAVLRSAGLPPVDEAAGDEPPADFTVNPTGKDGR